MGMNPLTRSEQLTEREQLKFAIDFAQMDLQHLTQRQLRTAEERIDSVLNPERPRAWRRVPSLGRSDLVELQTAAHDLLTRIALHGNAKIDLRLTFWAARDLRDDAAPDARAKANSNAYVPRVGLLVYGEPRDWFLYRIFQLLERLGVERLRVCPEEKCGHRLFFKVTRKEFCSTKCQSRFYMRSVFGPAHRKERKAYGKKTRTRRR